MNPLTDEFGRLLELRCHDGHLVGLEVLGSTIELRFRRLDGSSPRIVLNGVQYFALNGFLEGNIVDTSYCWPFSGAPAFQRRSAAVSFSCEESLLEQPNKFDADKLFVLESSYGATIHALVRNVEIVDDFSSTNAASGIARPSND